MGKYSIQFYNTLEQGSNASDNTTKNLQELTYKDHLYPYTEGVEATIESDNYKVTWASFSLHKRVYNAGKLELTFDISVEGSTLNIDKANTIYNQFKGYKSLRMQDNTVSDHLVVTNTVDLLTHYVIFNCKRIVTNARYSIVVTAYSPDKLLTIDKFNRAFTGKKFYADMVSGYLDTTGDFLKETTTNANLSPNLVAYKNCRVQLLNNLSNLSYTVTENEKSVSKEALLPYTVQHNESIWDFLVRIASRNGEFLFCENGTLHVGVICDNLVVEFVPSGTTCTSSQIAFDIMEEDACGYFQDASTLFDNDYLDSNRSVEKNIVSQSTQLNNSECIISPEINELVQKTDFSSIDDYVQHVRFIFDSVCTFFTESSILDAITSVGLAAFNSYHSGSIFVDKDNKSYNEYYFPAGNSDPLYAEKKKEGEENFYLFASSLKLLNNQFYHAVCNDSDYSRKNRLTFQFSEYVNVPLGATICYNNAYYKVWSVEVEHGICVVTVIPIVKLSETAVGKVLAKKDAYKIYWCMPIIDKTKRIAKATSQRAVVVDNYDPLKLGRVRVRYPWQPVVEGGTSDTYAGTKYNDISPWLRIVLPMASDGAGFMFMPNEGDEVMVDYEDGNIDRPYVCGSMYSINHQPGYHASTQLCGKTKSICTNNGHHLAFTDKPGDMRMLARMIPLWSQLSKFGMWNGKDMDSELGRHTTGGFEIADYLGIYSISGNTENRSVSIDSPIGKVSVSALTGISIEAPLGDVSIVGKNVKIEARNNLSIEAGTNIDNSLTDFSILDWGNNRGKEDLETLGMAAGGVVRDMLGLDIRFLRCMAEALLKPIGGGLAIKSHRYITIASGDGSASFQNDAPNDDENFTIAKGFTMLNHAAANSDINRVWNKFNKKQSILLEALRLYNDIVRKMYACNLKIQEVNALVVPHVWINEILVVDNKRSAYEQLKRFVEDTDGSIQLRNPAVLIKYEELYEVVSTLNTLIDDALNRADNVGSSSAVKGLKNNLKICKNQLANVTSTGELMNIDGLHESTGHRPVYRLAADCFSNYIKMDSTFPDTFSKEAIRDKMSATNGHVTVGKIASFARLKGLIDNVAWSQQNKGGILISNKKGKSYSLNNGTFTEIGKGDLVENLANAIFQVNLSEENQVVNENNE